MAMVVQDKKDSFDDEIINTVAKIVFDNYVVSMDVTESKCVGEIDSIHISIYLNKHVDKEV